MAAVCAQEQQRQAPEVPEEQREAPEVAEGHSQQAEAQHVAPADGSAPAAASWPAVPTEMLATQMMAPTADLLATQVMAPVGPDLLSTQVMRPVEASALMETLVPDEEGKQVEFERPTELKQVKKPKTAFWLFQDEVRSQVVEELGCGGAKVVAAMAAKWKELDEASRARYKGKAQELLLQYNKEIADGAIPAASVTAKKAARAADRKASATGKKRAAKKRMLQNLKRRAGPKKPKTSYSIWLCDHSRDVRAKLMAEGTVEPTFEEVARAAGKTWLALTPEQRAPYIERAQALAAKFKDISQACKEYKRANAKDAKARPKKKAAVQANKQTASKEKKAAAVQAKRATKTQKKADATDAKGQEAAGSGKIAETPQKRAAGASRPTPSKAKKAVPEPTAYLDMALVAEAEKAGMAGTFRKLAERDDMKAHPQRALLDALVASGGLLHRAKEALLAGRA